MPESTPHLTLAELTASGSNSPLSTAAAAHLDDCAACQARSRDAVADGVRFLLARCQPPTGLMDSVFNTIDTQAAPAHRSRLAAVAHLRWPAFRGRYGRPRIALAAAVVAVLLAAAGTGLATTLGQAGGANGAAEGGGSAAPHAGITLTECPRLQLQVLGRTLLGVSGTNLELEGAGSTPLTVTTTAGTEIFSEVAGSAADVTDGAHALVTGTATGPSTVAMVVAIMPEASGAQPAGRPAIKLGLAYGTVEDARSTGFTVVSNGTRIPVTMTASSWVIKAVPADLGELRAGQATSVVVSTGPNGTLTALSVEQGDLPPAALQALRESLSPSRLLPGTPVPSGTPIPLSSPPRSVSVSDGAAGPLLSLLGGAQRPFASLGCDPLAITSVNLLALALSG
jgi:hypothetical protein